VDDCVGALLEEFEGLLRGGAHEDVVEELLEELGAVEELFEERVGDVGDAHGGEVAFELEAGALVSDLMDADALVFELEVDLEGLDGFAAHLLGDVGGDEDDFEGGLRHCRRRSSGDWLLRVRRSRCVERVSSL